MSDDGPESTLTELAHELIDALDVPNSDMRRIFLELAALGENGEIPSAEMVVAQIGYLEMSKALREYFAKKTPLQEQAEFLRDRRRLKEEMGIEIPDHYNPH